MVPKITKEGGAIVYAEKATFLASRRSEFSGRIEFIRLHCLADRTNHDFPDEQAAHEFAKTYVPVPKHETN